MLRNLFTLLSISFLLFQSAVSAQVSIYEETDISAQNLLISAKKQVILGKLDNAIPIYEELLNEHNEVAAAYELSRIYFKKEDYSKAEGYAAQAYNREPDNQWYTLQYTEILTTQKEYEKAAKVFESSIKYQPDNEYYYLQASFNFLKAEKSKDAIRLLDNLEKNQGITEQIIQRKFEIYDVIGKQKDALKELYKLSDLFPEETRYLHNIAGYLRTMGREGEANKIMARILKIDPDDETALLFANSTGKNKDANYLRSLVPVIKDERIDLDKKVLEIIPYLQEFADRGNEELGNSLLDISLIMDENYPSNAKVKSILGDIYFYKRELASASENYRSSIELDKSVWTVWSQLLLTLQLNKDYEQLAEISENAIDVFPNQALSYYYYSYAMIENGNLGEAEISLMEATMIGSGNEKLGLELNYLGARIKYLRKDFQSAVDQIDEVISTTQRPNPKYLELKGDISHALNQREEAKKLWKAAIDAGGDKSALTKKIEGSNGLNN